MKPEPLKGKDSLFETGLFEAKDIRSAVEWLKKNIMKASCPPMYSIDEAWCNKFLFPLIDQAFEDVVKTTKEKG